MTQQNIEQTSELSNAEELSLLKVENEQLRQQLAEQSTAEQIEQTDVALRQRSDEQQHQHRTDMIQAKATGQVHAVLMALGYDEGDRQDFIQQMGGIASFVELDSNGSPVMQVAGRLVTLAEGIPQLPTVQLRTHKRMANDPVERLRREISANDEKLLQLRKHCQMNPADNHLVAQHSVIRRQTESLRQELAKLESPAEPESSGNRFAEPELLQQRDQIAEDIRQRQTRLTGPNDLAIPELARLKRKHRGILQQIHRQLSR